jgi:sugar phosphate isomerase/epimerase
VAESTEHIPSRLRYHIHVLGDLLGETIADQYGDGLVDTVEKVRKLSKSRRQSDPHLKSELRRVLRELQERELTAVTRAFNQFLQLSNIAEHVQTIAGDDPASASKTQLAEMFQTLLNSSKTPEEITDAILKLNCDLVLTAHPTQITRRTLIQKYDAIANVLQSLESGHPGQDNLKSELKRLITEIWHTDEIHLERSTPQEEAIWGYAGVYPGEFNIWQGDKMMNTLRFLADHGFESGHMGLGEMDDPARCDEIAQFIADHGMQMTVGVHMDWFGADEETLKKQADEFLEKLRLYGDLLRTPIVTTGAGRIHRFMDSPSLDEQLHRLSVAFAPIAEGCQEMGRPFGIENHGDYYIEDLVRLCKNTPHLGIFFDTGNAYLIGEKSIPACIEAAPYTIGTHFKDHYVHPDPGELKFVIEGAPIGSGHVGMAEMYRILLDNAPGDLVMQWEMVPPKNMDGFECLEESWNFVRNLPKE